MVATNASNNNQGGNDGPLQKLTKGAAFVFDNITHCSLIQNGYRPTESQFQGGFMQNWVDKILVDQKNTAMGTKS